MTLSAYRYRFYPNSEQVEMLAHTFGCVRFVYNNILAFAQGQYAQGNKTRVSDWSKILTLLKKDPDFEWLKKVSSVPLQQALRH